MTSLEIIEENENRITVKLKGVPLQYANALRRICLSGVPTFAVDDVVIIENSSVLADEGIAHRLAMIPLKTDLSRFIEPTACDCNSDVGCGRCRVLFMLDSGSADTTRTVTTQDLSSEDEVVKPVNPNIPIVQLAPGQKLKVEAYARLGRGTEHSKWNSAAISVLTEGTNPEEHVLTVETVGNLKASEVILAAINELEKRIGEFQQTIGAVS